MPEQRSRPKEGRVIALANQKGGTGKTTTTVNLGIGLARLGQKVLLIDADPQGDLTTCLGWQDQDSLQTTLATIMEKVIRDEPFSVDEGILHHKEGVDLMPANIELSAMEMSLVNAMSREFTLRTYVNAVKKNYDTVLIDCMPSLGMITINIEAGVIPKFAACVSQGVPWFQERGLWQDNSYEPRPGDIIFFDWDDGGQDGSSDHVGIVEKVENGRIYTIEGNSGDGCRQNSYPVGYYEIYGYGTPAY